MPLRRIELSTKPNGAYKYCRIAEFEMVIAGVVVSNRIFEKYKEAMPYYRNVQKEGVVLYERES